jgi:uncharacterized membrane protein
VLVTASMIGTILLVYGLVALQITAVLVGTLLAAGAKLWFVDRMVWLFEDMCRAEPHYRNWLVPDPAPGGTQGVPAGSGPEAG